ncbi:hypothetical protein FGO68_gene223 [Halteria grandinella]|uniref:Uncharacterized protein n=1 Tax=Halteria grandinella TaxID=5974 RepID=A0A8J8T9T0_HALGN|nr:hypothetical protein FGO68_gene223 [Halteria grandinella]
MVISLSQLDFLPSDWLSGENEGSYLIFNNDQEDHYSSLNNFFYMSGFPAKNSILNLGSSFLYTLACFCLAAFLVVLKVTAFNNKMQ